MSLSKWECFQTYKAYAQTLIEQSKFIQFDHLPQALQANLPFEIKPNNYQGKSCLLIHGLYDSPFTMQDLARTLSSNGIRTLSILLPGHGTTPADLNHTQYSEWQQCVKSAIDYLSRDSDQIILGGFSTGGTLAIDYVLSHKHAINSLLLFAPALGINSKLTCLLPTVNTLRNYLPRCQWLQRRQDDDYARYHWHSTHGAYELIRLQKKIDLNKINLLPPVFLSQSLDDEVINIELSLKTLTQNKHQSSRAIIYGRGFSDDNRMTIRKSFIEKEDILDFSHISIPVAEDNPHFGKNGDYQEPIKTNIFNRNKPIKKGSLTFRNLSSNRIQRLSYNPDYQYLSEELIRFVSD